jgi:hypothetical protein
MDGTSLLARLCRFRRRLLTLGGLAGAAYGFILGLGVLLLAIWIDLIWELSGPVRVGAWIAALAATAFVVSRVLALAWRRGAAGQLVRSLDVAGRTHGEIASGYSLSRPPEPAVATVAAVLTPRTATADLTAGLATLAVDQAVVLTDQVSPAAAVPSRQAARAGWMCAAAVAGLCLVALVAPRLAQTQWNRFLDPFGDHPPYSRTIFLVDPGHADVVYGRAFAIKAATQGEPVERLDLVLGRDGGRVADVVPMFPAADGSWTSSLARVEEPFEYFVRADGARSHRYQVGVMTIPQITDVRFRVTPPPYAHEAEYEGPMPEQGLAGLRDAVVEVTVSSNRPLQEGSLELLHGESLGGVVLSAVADDTTQVRGRFTIAHSARLNLSVIDVAGQQSDTIEAGSVSLLADAPPTVVLVEPAAVALATPTALLPVIAAAEDDYGISRLAVFTVVNEGKPDVRELAVPSQGLRNWQESVYVPLADLEVVPGDVVKVHARVEDTDPAGPQGAESSVAEVQIITEEEFQELLRAREGMEVLSSKYREARQRMESLADAVEGLRKKLEQEPAGAVTGERERDELRALEQKMREAAAAVAESMRQLQPYDLDESLAPSLEQLARQLAEAAEALDRLAENPPASPHDLAGELAELGESLRDETRDFERDVTQPLEELAELYPLLEDESRFTELAQRQRELATRLQDVKESPLVEDASQQRRLAELAQEQSGLQEELRRLLDDIERHANAVTSTSDEAHELAASALEFADAVRESGAGQAMDESEQALARFAGTEGHRAANEAADILEGFLSQCQQMGQQAGNACRGLRFSPNAPPGLGCTLEQLLADAGFAPGQKPGGSGSGQGNNPRLGRGMGQGAGDGYSARRSSLENIGLYGNLPTQGNPSGAVASQRRLVAGVPGGGVGTADLPWSTRFASDESQAAGAAEAAVPPQYRVKVQEYFERIAEETGR